MSTWYLFSIAALLLLGTQRFLYKVAAESNCSSPLTTAVFMGTVTILSTLAFLASGESAGAPGTLFILALANSASFALATIAHMEALKRLPAAVTFPLTRLSILVVIVFSVVYFDERLEAPQLIGILLAIAVVAVLAGDTGGKAAPQGSARSGFLFVAACVLCGAVASISSKLAAVATSKAAFMALSYLLATFFSLAIDRRWGKNKRAQHPGEAVRIGVLMGLLNFFGFYAFLAALSHGPLSVIALITGMHFVIAIALSALLYRERLTWRRSVAVALTLLAVFFLKN